MDPKYIEEIFYGREGEQRRFTQDFPILPDVWSAYAEKPKIRHELLLTPHFHSSAPRLAEALRGRIKAEQEATSGLWAKWHASVDGKPRILLNESVVFAAFSFYELVRVALPLSSWWAQNIRPLAANETWNERFIEILYGASNIGASEASGTRTTGDRRSVQRLIEIAGTIWHEGEGAATTEASVDGPPARPPHTRLSAQEQADAFNRLITGLEVPGSRDQKVLWSVNMNRPARISVSRSRLAVKADAAHSLFSVQSEGIRWAVIDTGIDATHKAFQRRNRANPREFEPKDPCDPDDQFDVPSRVVRTYDFLRFKGLLEREPKARLPKELEDALSLIPDKKQRHDLIKDLDNRLKHSRAIDWELLEPFLRVPHDPKKYIPPHLENKHGTHVAGILAGNWPEAETETAPGRPLVGVCPDLELYDIRALGPGADEFTVMAALQFVRHLNAHKDQMAVHGVNLSMSVPHDVANFACGRTPVCQECERVVSSGVVVVVAAGNRGFNRSRSADAARDGAMGDYRYISITDPGNAESVITVGSTHRYMPHTYGVSYFSSRGPTGDGRTKPDLVAPGERIDGPTPGGQYDTLDGTSMAAPHVSGAAALLMARHRELIGRASRIKEILCSTTTDLGREARFQGRGMLDVLRAVQSV